MFRAVVKGIPKMLMREHSTRAPACKRTPFDLIRQWVQLPFSANWTRLIREALSHSVALEAVRTYTRCMKADVTVSGASASDSDADKSVLVCKFSIFTITLRTILEGEEELLEAPKVDENVRKRVNLSVQVTLVDMWDHFAALSHLAIINWAFEWKSDGLHKFLVTRNDY